MGYWGPVTSTIDWCEDNYVYSFYIAEFWNTISCIFMSLWACIGLVIAIRRKLEWQFKLLYIITIFLGIGSAMFHASLRYFGQMCDEITMLWFIIIWGCIIIQIQFPHFNLLVFIICICYTVFLSFVHYGGAYIIEFQVHFVLIVILCLLRLLKYYKKKILHILYNHFILLCIGYFIIAACFWLLDQCFCNQVKLFFNPQGHAIWHIMNSLGIHYGIQYTLALRLQFLGYKVKPIHFILPFIVPLKIMTNGNK